MQGNDQRAYDRGITIFSPDGRLYQVEYAREAVRRGAASVGVRTEDGVVLVAERRVRSSLMEPDSVEKLHRVDGSLAIASAGHVADGRRLVDVARQHAQREQVTYGEAVDVETLTKAVTDHIQEYTQTGGARPYGAALLVGGVSDGEPRLFETDPSGTPYEWRATAIGGNGEAIREYLEAEYRPDLDVEGGIDLALSSLVAANDDVDPGDVEVAVVTADGFETLSADAVATRFAELDEQSED